MNSPHEAHPIRDSREHSIHEEQALCLRAVESGKYDSMSDKSWIALCEQVAKDARHIPEDESGDSDSGDPVVDPPIGD